MTTTTDKVRAALEQISKQCEVNDRTGKIMPYETIIWHRSLAKEALSLLEGHCIVPVGLLTEAASAVLLAREECRDNQYWYNTYGKTLQKLEDAVLIAPYVGGE